VSWEGFEVTAPVSLGFTKNSPSTTQPKCSPQGWRRMRVVTRVRRMGDLTNGVTLLAWRHDYKRETYKYEGKQQNECQENDLSRCTTIPVSLEPGRLFFCKSVYVLGGDQSRIFWGLKHPITWTCFRALFSSHNWGKQKRVTPITRPSTIRYSEHQVQMTYVLIVR